MPRFHLRHDLSMNQFLDALTDAAVVAREAGGDREAVREALKDVLSSHMLQADLCGIWSSCDEVQFFDPFVKIPK